MQQVKWGEFRLDNLFDITTSKSIDKNKITFIDNGAFDFVGRSRINNGVQGKVDRLSYPPMPKGTFSLVQVGESVCLYRNNEWYASQNIFALTPRDIRLSEHHLFVVSSINKALQIYSSAYTYPTLEEVKSLVLYLPTSNNNVDFGFIAEFVAELEAQRVAELETYLQASGLKDYTLTKEQLAIDKLKKQEIQWEAITYQTVFDNIKQGRRLKKDDQIAGNIPFIMAGTTNTGVVGYISNPVAYFPQNAITIDIFGNTFYRNYAFGAGDDTGVYWNESYKYTEEQMLFFTTSMAKSIHNKYSFGNKLRSSQSLNIEMLVPIYNGEIDLYFIDTLVAAIKKLVIKDIVEYANDKIAATQKVITTSKITL